MALMAKLGGGARPRGKWVKQWSKTAEEVVVLMSQAGVDDCAAGNAENLARAKQVCEVLKVLVVTCREIDPVSNYTVSKGLSELTDAIGSAEAGKWRERFDSMLAECTAALEKGKYIIAARMLEEAKAFYLKHAQREQRGQPPASRLQGAARVIGVMAGTGPKSAQSVFSALSSTASGVRTQPGGGGEGGQRERVGGGTRLPAAYYVLAQKVPGQAAMQETEIYQRWSKLMSRLHIQSGKSNMYALTLHINALHQARDEAHKHDEDARQRQLEEEEKKTVIGSTFLAEKLEKSLKLGTSLCFRNMDQNEVSAVMSDVLPLVQYRKIQKGRTLFTEGEMLKTIFFVLRGQLVIQYATDISAERLAIVGGGRVVGEQSVAADRALYASAVASRDTEVLEVEILRAASMAPRMRLLKHHLRVGLLVLQMTARRRKSRILSLLSELQLMCLMESASVLALRQGDTLVDPTATSTDSMLVVCSGELRTEPLFPRPPKRTSSGGSTRTPSGGVLKYQREDKSSDDDEDHFVAESFNHSDVLWESSFLSGERPKTQVRAAVATEVITISRWSLKPMEEANAQLADALFALRTKFREEAEAQLDVINSLKGEDDPEPVIEI